MPARHPEVARKVHSYPFLKWAYRQARLGVGAGVGSPESLGDEVHAEEQSASRENAFEETAKADIGEGAHARSPAAPLMAAIRHRTAQVFRRQYQNV
jgi:hypothetical protein